MLIFSSILSTALALAVAMATMPLQAYATTLETRPAPRPAVIHAAATDLEAAAVVAQVAINLGHEGGYNVFVDGQGLIRFQNPE